MTKTICINLNDTRLYASERQFIKNLSEKLINRTTLKPKSLRKIVPWPIHVRWRPSTSALIVGTSGDA